jgi:vacuolar-type H+-ATPase subunit F/Vma7
MTLGKLLVIGEKSVVDTFRLLGSVGLVTSLDDFENTIKYIEENKDEIGGILLTDSLYDTSSKLIRRINNSEIPWIVLPSGKQGTSQGYQELERLAEKAIGMKLKM